MQLMNFLAHFVLSYHDSGLLAGNFIADSVKGRKWEDYPEDIAKGILHHRFIDDFTDKHPVTRELTKWLRPTQGKYAGVAADIIYDHILALSFSEVTGQELSSFAQSIYQELFTRSEHFPRVSHHILESMSSRDWLSGYATAPGIEWAFKGVSARASGDNNLQDVPVQIYQNIDLFFNVFRRFFPDLQVASGTYLESLRRS